MIQKLKSLKGNQSFMKYFMNTSWIFGEKILRMGVGLFVGIWVARFLGPEQYGLFSYAQSFVGLFAVVANLGLDGIVVRELVKDESKKYSILGTAFGLKLIGGIGVLLILAIAVNLTSNNTSTNILIFIIASSTIFQSFNVIDFYFQSKVLSKYVVYANTIVLFISSVLKIILILNEAPLIAFAWVVLFDSLILGIGLLYMFMKKTTIKIQQLTFHLEIAKLLLKASLPLIIAGFAIGVYKKIDQVMLQNILESSLEVGYYAAAVQLTLLFVFLPGLVTQSIFPLLIEKHKEKKYKEMKTIYLKINSSLFYLSLLLFVFFFFFSTNIVELTYGRQYAQSAYIVVIHFAINIFLFTGILVDKLLIIDNKQLNITYRVIIGAVLNILFNYILIPKYGAVGASFATVASQFITSFVLLFLFRDSRKYAKWQIESLFYIFRKKQYV